MLTTLIRNQRCFTNQGVTGIALTPAQALVVLVPKKQLAAAPSRTFVSTQLLHLELFLCSQPPAEEPFPQL